LFSINIRTTPTSSIPQPKPITKSIILPETPNAWLINTEIENTNIPIAIINELFFTSLTSSLKQLP